MRSSAKRDLIVIAFVLFVGTAFAIAFDVFELVFELTRQFEEWELPFKLPRQFEEWELDEIVVIVVSVGLGALWFAWRRWHEGKQFIQLIRDALDSAEDGFLIYGPDDRLIFRNARHQELYPDFGPHMAVGKKFADIIEAGRESGVSLFEPEDEYLDARGKLRDTPGKTYRLRTLQGDRHIDNRDVVTEDGYLVSTRTDVTDRARYEQELTESEERFRNLVEGSLQGILVHQDARPVFVNEAWARMHGYKMEEVLALDSIMAAFAPHERERLEHYRKARLRGEDAPVSFEYEGLRKDGAPISVSNIARVIAWNGRPAVQSTSFDITEQKAAERELAESEQRFRNLAEGLIAGISVHIGFKILFCNPAWARIFGYTLEEIAELDSTLDLCADWERSRIEGYAAARSRGEEAPTEYEYQGIKKDGSLIWLRNMVRVVEWDSEPAIQTTVFDITNQRTAEQELADNEARLRLITDSLPVLIAYVDKQHRFQFNNSAYKEWFGIDPESAKGRHVRDVLGEDAYEIVRGYYERVVRNAEPVQYEAWIRYNDGERRRVVSDCVPDISDTGEVEGFFVLVQDVTDMTRAEEALVESEQRYRDLIEQSVQAIVIHRGAKPLLVNEAWARMHGYTVEEALQLDSTESTMAPHERERMADYRDARLRGEDAPTTYEYEGQRKDGSSIWVSNTVRVVEWKGETAVQSTGIDITERKLAEQALRESEARFRDFADTAADWFWEMGPDLRISYVSERVEQVYGVPVEWHIGRTLEELAGESVHEEKWRKHLQDLRDHKPFNDFTFARKGPDGEIVHVTIAGAPILSEDGEFQGFRGTGRDVTDQVRAEEEIVMARDAARKMAESAEEANRAKSEFLANMSHEIRTPMNAVLGLAHLLTRDNLSPEQEDKVEKIQAAGTHLLGIINDILDFSRIESDRLELEETEFQLDSILFQVASVNALRAAEKGLEFLYDVGADVPRQLQGDSVRLRQMLVNLVDNAIKFTETGEVIVTVALDRQEIDCAWLTFQVRDTGIGMTEEQQARLFQPFVQADTSTIRHFGGSGLGLAICKGISELMGGTINLESTVGGGSTFRFTVPLQVRDEPLFARPPDLSDLRVLVVDDHEISRGVLTAMLQNWSISSVAVPSGEAALELLTEPDIRFDLAIIDWQMPGLGGVETARLIQSAKATDAATPKIVILTAYGREDAVAANTDLEIEDVLTKPVQEFTLFNAVTSALARTSARRPEAASEDAHAGLSGAHVLLAEDNKVNQEVARQLLEYAGVVVTVANNGAEAAAAALASGSRFDAVLMDIQMPELDGIEATELIRERTDEKSLPVIAMTAHATEYDRQRCLAAGMNDHLGKPVEPEVMYATLRKWISGPEQTPVAREEILDTRAAALSGEAVELPSITGLDMRIALKRNGNRLELVQQLFGMFLRSFGNLPHTLATELLAGNIAEIRRHAHTLRSSARTIGAESLGLAADALERAAEHADANTRSLAAPAEEFAEELAHVLDSLATFESEKPKPTHSTEYDLGRIAILIDQLEPLIEEGNFEARRVVEELEESLEGTELARAASEVRAHVENLEETAAAASLASLATRLRALESGDDGK